MIDEAGAWHNALWTAPAAITLATGPAHSTNGSSKFETMAKNYTKIYEEILHA